MTKVVVRGESVYQCDICNRSTRVPTNKTGMDVLLRCVITSGCQGNLHRVTLAKQINETPAFPPEVEGVRDWFPRRVLFTHDHPVQNQVWLVQHNLASKPTTNVYVNRYVDGKLTLVRHNPVVKIIDLNTVMLTFATAESGIAQCTSLSSQNTTNLDATVNVGNDQESIQITSNSGEVSIATLSDVPLLGLGLTYMTAGSAANVVIDYAGIDRSPSVLSPWVGAKTAIINGKKYTVRSFNLITTPLAPGYFAAGSIPSGSAFYVSSISGLPPKPNQVLILLANSPYEIVDRITNSYIDVANVNNSAPETYYSLGVGYARSSVVKSTYPRILVV